MRNMSRARLDLKMVNAARPAVRIMAMAAVVVVLFASGVLIGKAEQGCLQSSMASMATSEKGDRHGPWVVLACGTRQLRA